MHVLEGLGSFTGIRIGVATAKAFSDAKNIPIIGIDSLEALAYSVILEKNVENAEILAMVNAKNNNVYAATYLVENGKLRMLKNAEVMDLTETVSYIEFKKHVYIVGCSVEDDIKKLINENSKENIKNSYIIHTEELISEKFNKLNDVYTYLFNNEIEVSIDLKDSIVTGLINKIEDEFLLVDGNKIYKKDILYISTNTEEQRTYKFLGVEAYE